MKHDAFISYSHAADGALAPALQRGLERFAKPWYGLRALAVFRDDTNLFASPHLWQSIVEELAETRWFLLMASPEAARSKWVAREVLWWLEHRNADHLLILVTDGELVWDDTAARPDFDWTRTTGVPSALAGVFAEEPHFIDVRGLRRDANLTLKHTAFRAAVLKIAAPLHGRSPDQMDGDAVRAQARNRRWAGGALASLVVLALLAVWQAIAATRARDIALSRQLAAQSTAILDRGVDTSMLLAVQAWRTSPTAEARSAMLRGLHLGPIVRFLPAHRTPIVGVVMEPEARWAISASEGGEVTRIRVDGSVPDWSYHSDQTITSLAMSADAAALAIGLQDGHVRLLAPGGSAPAKVLGDAKSGSVTALAFAPDGSRLVAGDHEGGITSWAVATGASLGGVQGQFNSSAVDALACSGDGTLIYSARGLSIVVWNSDTWQQQGALGDGKTEVVIDALALVPEAGAVTTAGWHDNQWHVQRWPTSPAGGAPTVTASKVRGVMRLAYNADGRVLALGSIDGQVAFQVAGTESIFKAHHGKVRGIAISADGRYVVSGGEDGRLVLWDRQAKPPHSGRLGAGTRGAAPIVASPDGRALVSGAASGQLLWMTPGRTAPMLRIGPIVPGLGEARSALRGVTAVAYAPDGAHVAVGLADGTVVLQPVDETRPAQRAQDWGAGYPVRALAFSPDGRTLVSAHYDGSVVLRDPVTAAPRANPANIINDSHDGIRALTFSADGARLLVEAGGRGVVVRDVAALATASRATSESALAFTARETGPPLFSALARSPADGTWAWGSPNGEVQIRKTDNATADGPPLVVEGGMRIGSLAFSPDRTTLAVTGGNGPIVLWDVDARRRVDEPLREARAGSMAFTIDGRFLVTRSGQGELEWWSTDGAAWADRLCAIVGRRFTEREWTTYIGTTDVDNAACMSGSR
jgi:WD40 repeat protein